MKLMMGKLFWNTGVSVPCYPLLENDMICDVLSWKRRSRCSYSAFVSENWHECYTY